MRNLNLTPRAQKLVKLAHKTAEESNSFKINHLHIFLSFFEFNYNQITEAFDFFEVNIADMFNEANAILKKISDKERSRSKQILASAETKKLFRLAKKLSTKYDHKYIGLEHIFLSLFEEPDHSLRQLINGLDIDYDKILDYVENKLEEDDLLPSSMQEENEKTKENPNEFNPKKYKFLNSYATNLNTQVIQGKINSLHLNRDLIKKISEVLCRKTKSNPLIIGEAGVGKTALVESLAQAIVEGESSDFLLMKNIYNLDVAMIIAGCKYRGEFEEKIKNIIQEVSDDPFVILFIDEIHTIIGAGNPENGMDVANILKPYLTRGEITCIGATTFDEYKKTIAKDPALSRRFQSIKIEEPTKKQVFTLLKNIKSSYEAFHYMQFSDEMIRFTISASDKYIEGRFPDKALDIIDQVGAKVKLKNFTKSAEMVKLENKIKDLTTKEDQMYEKDFHKKINDSITKYQKATEKLFNKWKDKKYRIKNSDILEVVSDKTNIPIAELKKQDSEKIKTLRNKLQTEIIGQDEQIVKIYKCLLRAKAGFRKENKPIASMLFAGATGVGKTITAKIIAETLFVNKNNFISFDLSEYTDKTAVNKLIGSNPGYIGYDKGGVLTEKVKRNPYSLILFDEIQKAHQDVLFALQQILEEGKISDSSGSTVDFSNTIIIMTTNIGADVATSVNIGFNKDENNSSNDIISSVKKYFPPDLLNRTDEIIPFNLLKEKEIKIIITKQLEEFKKELISKKIGTVFSKDLCDFIYSKIQFNNFGARQVLKTIQREIQTLVAEKILSEPKTLQIKIGVKKDNICVI